MVLGWLYQLFFTVFRLADHGARARLKVPVRTITPCLPGGWMLLLVFVVFDVLLLFWLPTLLASPRSYRFVVPGAVKFLGGR